MGKRDGGTRQQLIGPLIDVNYFFAPRFCCLLSNLPPRFRSPPPPLLPPTPHPKTKSSWTPNSTRILYVEDDRMQRIFVSSLFQGIDVDALEVSCAPSAYHMIKRLRFDVILIDFWLEKMTADVLVSWVFNIQRQHGEKVPLLVVCSNSDLLHLAKEKMFTYGQLVQYLEKPLTPAKLQNFVNQAKARKAAFSSLSLPSPLLASASAAAATVAIAATAPSTIAVMAGTRDLSQETGTTVQQQEVASSLSTAVSNVNMDDMF